MCNHLQSKSLLEDFVLNIYETVQTVWTPKLYICVCSCFQRMLLLCQSKNILCWMWLALVFVEWFVAPDFSLWYFPIWCKPTVPLSLNLSLSVSQQHICYSHIVSLISFWAKDPWLQLGAAAAAPAARCDAHASLRRSLTVAVSSFQPLSFQPLAVWLALCALRSVVDVACWGTWGRLRGDGAQQMVPLPQEVAVCT